ncbi:unnamed protein product [Paramecium pentaurelia]|uniref:C3H1-type domain-containing protein n=1 Tax=Paramecium pentaurelia TaxID=43138 RepID=A0A8S1U202_9CILI|nr:unnamed protein product [Paramecium pentaurelia]
MHHSIITIPQHGNGRLYKTSICRHYEYGNCSIGTKCQFAHGVDELRNPDDPIPIHIPTLDSNIVITNYKTVLCKYDQQGFCKNGTDCPYAHGQNDKKQARIAPLHLRKALDNKENNDDKDVELFLSELITRLINDVSYQSDESALSSFRKIQSLIEEKNHRSATEALCLVLSSNQRSKQQQMAYEQIYNSLVQ